MRFRFRTDLERVYEAVNERHFGEYSSKIIDKQLKDLNLILEAPGKKKTFKQKTDSVEDDKDTSENNEKYEERLQYIEDEGLPVMKLKLKKKKNNFLEDYKSKVKRKFVDNSGAKQIFYELHRKTFFKAASTMVINPPKEHKKLKERAETKDQKKKLVIDAKKTVKAENKDNTIENYFRKIPLSNMNYDIIKGNPLLYNINFNPLKKEEKLNFNDEQFELLKKLSVTYKLRTTVEMDGFEEAATIKETRFAESIKLKDSFRKDSLILSDPFVFFSSFKANEMMEGRKEKDIERIMIDGKVYPKYEIELITKKVLDKCKYIRHKKNKSAV